MSDLLTFSCRLSSTACTSHLKTALTNYLLASFLWHFYQIKLLHSSWCIHQHCFLYFLLSSPFIFVKFLGILWINIAHSDEYPTSQISTSQTSCIQTSKHSTSGKSNIPNISHPKYSIFKTPWILSNPDTEHLTSQTFYFSNIPYPK